MPCKLEYTESLRSFEKYPTTGKSHLKITYDIYIIVTGDVHCLEVSYIQCGAPLTHPLIPVIDRSPNIKIPMNSVGCFSKEVVTWIEIRKTLHNLVGSMLYHVHCHFETSQGTLLFHTCLIWDSSNQSYFETDKVYRTMGLSLYIPAVIGLLHVWWHNKPNNVVKNRSWCCWRYNWSHLGWHFRMLLQSRVVKVP